MKTETTFLHLAALHGLPGSGSAGADTVTGLVMAAVDETCHTQSSPPVLPALAERELSAPWLLRVLICSYARGVLGSEDIKRKLHAESRPEEVVPDFDTLRRIRRLNRALIEAALEKVLRALRLRQRREASANPAAPADLGAETTILLHHEATARIQEAVLLDHAATGE